METSRGHLMSDAYASMYENRRAAANPENHSEASEEYHETLEENAGSGGRKAANFNMRKGVKGKGGDYDPQKQDKKDLKAGKNVDTYHAEEQNYTASYMEAYKKLPSNKMQDKAATKPDTAKGESQARKMDTVRTATKEFPGEVKDAVKGQEMSNKKKGLEKRFAAPSAKKNKNKAYELEGQRRRDLDKRYGSKNEEVEQIDEVAPLVAGLAGKAAGALAGKAAAGGAAKVGGGLAKAASSKMGQKAISAGSNMVGNKVADKLTTKKEELTLDDVAAHLWQEGYALSEESALHMANHMSEQWLDTMIEGYPGHEDGDDFAKKRNKKQEKEDKKRDKESDKNVPF